MIKFPVRVQRGDDARFAYIVDSNDSVIAGGISEPDAEELVAAANAGTNRIQIQKPARRKNKREQIAEKLRESDPMAVIMERDEIVYGLPDELPQAGESVARLGSKPR